MFEEYIAEFPCGRKCADKLITDMIKLMSTVVALLQILFWYSHAMCIGTQVVVCVCGIS